MSTTHLTFMWHMHQPYYRNMATGECIQPWVRLHGTRSYYDMMKLYEEFPDISCEINFVPSLLRQIREYIEEGKTDKFLQYTLVPAQELIPVQKIFILRNFFMANPQTMIKPYQRYWKLYQQRGENIHKIDFEDAIRYFSWQDYLDIQVYYNLVWFGFKAREEMPEIEQMLARRHFTEEDKKFVTHAQGKIMARLLESIRHAPKNIELTTTPFFHPIFPLLIDTNIAKRSMPNAALPHRFSLPRHAEFQLSSSLDYFEQTVGARPVGMWPAEGSVCPEMVPMLANAGIKWIATDEAILQLSGVSGNKSEYLHRPYTVEADGKQVSIVFRDRELSDLIGFSYGKMNTSDAIEDFAARIGNIAKSKSSQLITVLLDGENPWESYEEGGKPFLTGLLKKLEDMKFPTTTIGGFLAEHPPKQKLTTLHSGSWINANFGIWIGKPQKNQAWDYIKRTAAELGAKMTKILDNPKRDQKESLALESFAAACGSDWFWWFDDDFESEFKSDFDKIFRMHLKNTFTFLDRDIPIFLFDPIYKYEERLNGPVRPPAFIYPVIDGINTSFFEWTNAVRMDISKNRGTMGQSNELIETIYFGFNPEEFFLRTEPLNKDITFCLGDEEEMVIYIHNHNAKYKLRLFFDGHNYRMQTIESPEEGYAAINGKIEWAVRAVFEMGLKFSDLGFKPGEDITLIVTVVKHGIEARRYSHISFVVPDAAYESYEWSV